MHCHSSHESTSICIGARTLQICMSSCMTSCIAKGMTSSNIAKSVLSNQRGQLPVNRILLGSTLLDRHKLGSWLASHIFPVDLCSVQLARSLAVRQRQVNQSCTCSTIQCRKCKLAFCDAASQKHFVQVLSVKQHQGACTHCRCRKSAESLTRDRAFVHWCWPYFQRKGAS